MSIIALHDPAAGTSAKVLPEFGFNCYSFIANYGGQAAEVLWCAPGVESGRERPSGSGVPILFPFPGRVRGTEFEFGGRTYHLPPGDAFGNAIHGFVLDRPWEVIEQSKSSVVGRFNSARFQTGSGKDGHSNSSSPQSGLQPPASSLRPISWPAAYRLTVAWSLAGNSLTCDILVENPDERPLTWGLGLHPYFRVPLTANGRAADCRVTVPARRVYELVDMIPSGATRQATGRHDLAAGKLFPNCQFDDVFTDLTYIPAEPVASTPGSSMTPQPYGCGSVGDRGSELEGECLTTISDIVSGRRLTVAFGSGFSHCVVYNPPHRQAICIEPYTCAPGMFGQGGAAACEDVLAILPPGGAARLKMRISAE